MPDPDLAVRVELAATAYRPGDEVAGAFVIPTPVDVAVAPPWSQRRSLGWSDGSTPSALPESGVGAALSVMRRSDELSSGVLATCARTKRRSGSGIMR